MASSCCLLTPMDSRPVHFHLDPVKASVPDLVRRIVPEHVRHARSVDRAPDRALDVVGVQESPTARLLGHALEDVLLRATIESVVKVWLPGTPVSVGINPRASTV